MIDSVPRQALHPAVQASCLGASGTLLMTQSGATLAGVGMVPLLAVLVVWLRPSRAVFLVLWALILACLLLVIAVSPFTVANHLYLAAYMALAMMFSLSGPDADDCMSGNARWLLGGVLLFAVIQKVLSPSFMSGEWPGYMLASGMVGKYTLPLLLSPDLAGEVAANAGRISHMLDASPKENEWVELVTPISNLREWSFGFTALILMMEGALAALLLFHPRSKAALLTLLLFLTVIVAVRPELAFASVFAALCAALYGKQEPARSWLFGFCSILLMLAEVWFNQFKGIA